VVLYYAMGGGLGHLVRARAVLHTLGLEGDAALVTASPHAADARVTGGLPVHAAPDGAIDAGVCRSVYRAWLAQTLARLRPEEIFVDTFPAGLLGELADLRAAAPRARLTYVGRLLRWGVYRDALPAGARPPRFDRAFLVEPLHADHAAAVGATCDAVRALALRDPPAPPPAGAADAFDLPDRPWLVVHSGPAAELDELLAYARELQRLEGAGRPLVAVTPLPRAAVPAGVAVVDAHPASALFARAARIVTACGFNLMRQTQAHQDRHSFLPFPRRFDDQFARAARRRAGAPAGGDVSGPERGTAP
jgi:hypothetical protein